MAERRSHSNDVVLQGEVSDDHRSGDRYPPRGGLRAKRCAHSRGGPAPTAPRVAARANRAARPRRSPRGPRRERAYPRARVRVGGFSRAVTRGTRTRSGRTRSRVLGENRVMRSRRRWTWEPTSVTRTRDRGVPATTRPTLRPARGASAPDAFAAGSRDRDPAPSTGGVKLGRVVAKNAPWCRSRA